jgi:hypothetical protein
MRFNISSLLLLCFVDKIKLTQCHLIFLMSDFLPLISVFLSQYSQWLILYDQHRIAIGIEYLQ